MKSILLLLISMRLFSYEILTYGDAIIDYIVHVEKEDIDGPIGGSYAIDLDTFQKLTTHHHKKCSGGSGVNTTKGLASLGHDCAVIGRVGHDLEGQTYQRALSDRSIDCHFAKYNFLTGRVVSLVTPDGERTMRGFVGPLKHCERFDVDPCIFQKVKLFHIEGYQIPNTSFLKELISHAKKEGALISMDLGCFEFVKAFKNEILELIDNHLDIVFCNKDEAKTLTGLGPKETCKMIAKKCKVAVVTTGAIGGFVAANGEVFHYPADLVKPIDDTAAGDLFMAGFLHSYLHGKDLKACAAKGAELASLIVQVEGGELNFSD